MSKKDYIKFAAMVSELDFPILAKEVLIDQLCKIFNEDNPVFNESKFREACDG